MEKRKLYTMARKKEIGTAHQRTACNSSFGFCWLGVAEVIKKGNKPQGSAEITGTHCEKGSATCN